MAFWQFRRGLASSGWAGLGWFAFGGLAAGFGVWATHFIAMLAFQPALKTGYHPTGTIASLLIGVVTAAAGFALAARVPGRMRAVIGGVVLGSGIGLMHFIGMASFQTQGLLIWNGGYVFASIAFGVALSIVSLLAAGQRPTLRRCALGAVLLVLAICGLHFTAMAAVSILPDPTMAVPSALAARTEVALMIGLVTLMVLGSAAVITLMEAWNRRGSLEKLRLATNAMPAAMAFYDTHDRLVLWNKLYEQIVPGGGETLKAGMTFSELLTAYAVDESFIAKEHERRREGTSSVHQFSDGRWIRIENVPTGDGGLVTVGIDVSSLKRDAETLKAALDRAEAGSRVKSEFLANISHEIRTPLNGVAGVANVLAGTELTDRQSELVELIRTSARQVDVLLADVLALSSMDGRSEVIEAPFNLAKAIGAAANAHWPLARDKGVRLELELEAGLDLAVDGDVQRLARILDALIGNAVKFTAQGQVTVIGKALDAERFRIEVQDTGIGFDPDEKDRLFELFSQSDSSATRRHGGAGLGLSLAQENARLLDATLDCQSTPGQGSVFWLELRLPASDRPARGESSAAKSSALALAGGARAPTALIVDDNAINRRVLELILDQLGMIHVSVADGRAAVEARNGRGFDVILMDIQMPVMDGITATREIRRLEALEGASPTPVIMVSANCLPEHVQAAHQAGAQRHLAKPVNATDLIDALNSVFDRQDQRAA